MKQTTWGQAQIIYSEFAVAMKSATVTCILVETQTQEKSGTDLQWPYNLCLLAKWIQGKTIVIYHNDIKFMTEMQVSRQLDNM